MINRLVILTILAATLTAKSTASTPLQLDQTYNSGYVGTTPIAAGLPDLDFTLYSFQNNVSIPLVASPIPAAWATVTGAQWIAPTVDQAYPSDPAMGDLPGVYDYNAELETDFLVPTSITITGGFAADNAITLVIDGTPVTTASAPAYGSLTAFSFTFTLNNVGTHLTSIDFFVNNLDDTNGNVNPTGLLVSNLKATTSSVPEPKTWLMFFGGLAALVGMQRLRRVGNV